MKVMMVNRLMGISRGGGENFDINMANALCRLGCEVSFLVGRRWSGVDCPVDDFPATYVRTPYFRHLHYRWNNARSRVFRGLSNRALIYDVRLFERATLRTVARMKDRPDVFQLCGLTRLGTWLTARTGIPSVVRWAGPPSPPARKWAPGCSAHIANGDALVQARRDLPCDVHDIPPGVDIERFHPGRADDLRATYEIAPDDVVVLFTGRLVPIKNLQFLIDGFAAATQQAPTLKLVLVGDGGEKEALRQQAESLGISDRVVFAGEQRGEALAAHYRMADVFAITSHYDNFPNVVLEAMSAGLPVVGTRVGGIPLQVTAGENGFLVDKTDVPALSVALVQLANNEGMREDMGHANRARVVAAFNWSASAQTLSNLYQRLVEDAR